MKPTSGTSGPHYSLKLPKKKEEAEWCLQPGLSCLAYNPFQLLPGRAGETWAAGTSQSTLT